MILGRLLLHEQIATCHNNQRIVKEMQLEKNGKSCLLRIGKEPRKIGQKKGIGLLIPNKWSNNTQLLTNGSARSKHFILFKLSYQSRRV
ncbi:hypothetical protein OA190_02020 [Prochlorococcus sp. AH-736-A13]|nr:hypothetical protein [Prochlorococcus sp. AH-736-A13]